MRAAAWNPIAKLYARVKEDDLRTKFIVEKELGNRVNIIYGEEMHFDKIIMNPPYDGPLHLKILSEAIKHGTEVVNLSPIRWLQDPLAEKKKNTDYNSIDGKNIRQHIKSLTILSKSDTDRFFSILSEPLGIYVCSFEKQKEYKIDFNFAERILKNVNKFYKDYLNKKETLYKVPVAKYHWTSGTEPFTPFTLSLTENGTYAKSNWTKGLHDTYEIFYFETKNELENFKLFLRLKSYKWVLGKLLTGKRLPINLIPMMPTYTHPWTDEMLYKYFDLTQEEIETIENEIK